MGHPPIGKMVALRGGLPLLGRGRLRSAPLPQGSGSLSPQQDLRYIFIPSDLRDYVMLRAAVLGEPVRKGPDQGDR